MEDFFSTFLKCGNLKNYTFLMALSNILTSGIMICIVLHIRVDTPKERPDGRSITSHMMLLCLLEDKSLSQDT